MRYGNVISISQAEERGVMANGQGSRSAVDGELIHLQNMDIGVIHPYEDLVGHHLYSYCAIYYISKDGKWGEKVVSGDKELILKRIAIVLFHQKNWDACRLVRGKGYCPPVDMGHGNLFIQIRGKSKTDFYNLKFYKECCERSNGSGLTEVLMKGNRVFFSTSKKETIEKKRVLALQLVREKLCSDARHLEEKAAEYGYADLFSCQNGAVELPVPLDISMIPLSDEAECVSAKEECYHEEPLPPFHLEELPEPGESAGSGKPSTIHEIVENYIPEDMAAQGKWMAKSDSSSSPCRKRCRFLRNRGELENRSAQLYEDLLSLVSG
jgi:hypothetical protein